MTAHSDTFDVTEGVFEQVQQFYEENPQIKASHGWAHVQAVYRHSCEAVACQPSLSSTVGMEIRVAALLHDVDDHKYFSTHDHHENARTLLRRASVPSNHVDAIVYMISLVSCSANGNSIPPEITESGTFHLLIPRWSDRLEAVGAIGVIRCYQYNREHKHPLWSDQSPRAKTRDELWALVTPARFDAYQATGTSEDMISHYYDKLLRVACPPKYLVRNPYLERMAEDSSKELVEVCLSFGRMGAVDEDYIQNLAIKMENR